MKATIARLPTGSGDGYGFGGGMVVTCPFIERVYGNEIGAGIVGKKTTERCLAIVVGEDPAADPTAEFIRDARANRARTLLEGSGHGRDTGGNHGTSEGDTVA